MLFDNFIFAAEIVRELKFMVKLQRANGGCLGARER